MQEYKNEELTKASEGFLKDLLEQGKTNMENGSTDSFTVAMINKGNTFEIKGLKFIITEKLSRGRIKAKLIRI